MFWWESSQNSITIINKICMYYSYKALIIGGQGGHSPATFLEFTKYIGALNLENKTKDISFKMLTRALPMKKS